MKEAYENGIKLCWRVFLVLHCNLLLLQLANPEDLHKNKL